MKKYSRIILQFTVILSLQCFPFFTFAQITVFQKIYPSSLNQSGKDVLAVSGGYLIAASTEDNIANDLDVEIIKTNSVGDTLWTKRYGGARPDYPNGMLATADGNYFIIGSTQSFGGGDQDIYLLKINPQGDTLWTKRYGGFGNEEGKEIVATADGNYVIVSASNSLNFSNNDMLLIKIDPSGAVQWMKYYGGPQYESARSVKLCLDGGFIIAGKTAVDSASIATLYIVKTDVLGDTLWTKKYSGGTHSYEGKFILANNDGSYTLCMDDSSATRDSDVRIMNLSTTGSIVWNYMYGGLDKDITKMIQPTSDGGYIVASISRSFGWINPDMWILKLNSLGDTTWTRHYGGSGHEHCFAVRQTTDGGYIAVGHSKSYTPNTEVMLVKLDTLGNIPAGMEEFAWNNSLAVYPNPSVDGIVNIEIKNDNIASVLNVTNVLGQKILSEKIEASSQNKVIDIGNQLPGIYFITLQSQEYLTTKKLILK